MRESGRLRHHWPDLVVLAKRGPVAVEFEFTNKSKERLRGIVAGYLASPSLAEVRYLVTSPLLASRLARLAFTERPLLRYSLDRGPKVVVDAWHGADAATRAAIKRAAGDLRNDATHVQHHLPPRRTDGASQSG